MKNRARARFVDLEFGGQVRERTLTWRSVVPAIQCPLYQFALALGQHVFGRVSPGEQRSIEIPFTTDWFDDRSWILSTGLLQVVL